MTGQMLCYISAHGRACLMTGLLTGLLVPRLAALMVPWLPHMVAALLAITALRIGHRAALGATRDLGWGLAAVGVLQLGVPLMLLALMTAFGVATTPAALAVLLATAGPAISGSTNLALLMGLDAGRMMQILVLGTAAFPVTVLPVLWFAPQLADPLGVVQSAAVVLVVILAATATGFGARAALLPDPTPRQVQMLDGASMLAFSVMVVGLMAPLNGALRETPLGVAGWTALAFVVSYGLQGLTLLVLRRGPMKPVAGPLAIGAGSRNIALFLVALPADTIAPVLIFVACWQLPMYLTPMLLPRLYSWALTGD
ncbi:hypothetical protein K3756_00985 [Sulfitobacter sp. S190]|nr:hypothetical protein K3756_00985 [Sulfitobacter sp. S190]